MLERLAGGLGKEEKAQASPPPFSSPKHLYFFPKKKLFFGVTRLR